MRKGGVVWSFQLTCHSDLRGANSGKTRDVGFSIDTYRVT